MDKAFRLTEKNLLDALVQNLPPEKYPEIARLVLQYGVAAKSFGASNVKEEILTKIQQVVNDINYE